MTIKPTVDVMETRRHYAGLVAQALTDEETPGVITEDELQQIADGMAAWVGEQDTWEQTSAAMMLARQQLQALAAHWGAQPITVSGRYAAHDTELLYEPTGPAAFARAAELWLLEHAGLFKGVAPTRAKDLKLIKASLPAAGWGARQDPLEVEGGAVIFNLDGTASHNPWYHFHYKPERFGGTAEGMLWVEPNRQYVALRPVGDGIFAGVLTDPKDPGDPNDPEARPRRRFEHRIVLRLNPGLARGEIDYLKREIDIETGRPRADEGLLVTSELSQRTTSLFRAYASAK